MLETPESLRSRDPLVEAAVRPLSGNAELHLAAAGWIAKLRTSDQGTGPAIARWNALDARRHGSVWRVVLGACVVLVSSLVWFGDSKELLRYFEWGKWSLTSFGAMPPESTQRVGKNLNEQEKLLLFGDPNLPDKDEQKEALWRSEPENPAYFVEYASAYVGEHSELPPDFLETAKRIDPDNAWFTYFAAAVTARECVKSQLGRRKRADGKVVHDLPQSWEILDQARLDRSLELFREARKQPKCESYSAEMLLKRLPLLRQENFIQYLDSISCLSNATVFGGFQMIHVTQAAAAKAWQFGEASDSAGFLELCKDADAHLQAMVSMGQGTLVDELVFSISAGNISESFGRAAEKLGLQKESDRWKRIALRLRERNDGRSSRSFIVDGKAVEPKTITGALGGGSLEAVAMHSETQVPLTAADLEPGRMIDHEVLSRFSGYAVWLLLGLCLGVSALYRLRISAMVRCLARRVEDLLLPVDWLWILGGGVLLPFAFVMTVNRLTPLGARDFGLAGNSVLLPVPHFIGLFLLWLVSPISLIRWRLARRAGCLGFAGSSWLDGLALLGAAAFVPAIGWVGITGSPGDFWTEWMGGPGGATEFNSAARIGFWVSAGLLAVPLLWFAVTCLRSIFTGPRRLFHGIAVSLILTRAHAAAMLVMIVGVAGFKAAEYFWFQQDNLIRFYTSIPGWSRFEHAVASQMRKEVREILGYGL